MIVAECDANEEYSQCGTPCPSTCDRPEEIFCRAKCGPGCFCKKGLVRNAAKKCVEVKQCPGKTTNLYPSVKSKISIRQQSNAVRTKNTMFVAEDVVMDHVEIQQMQPKDALVTAKLVASAKQVS
jgi:hypothetical protein